MWTRTSLKSLAGVVAPATILLSGCPLVLRGCPPAPPPPTTTPPTTVQANASPVAVDDRFTSDEDVQLDLPASGAASPAANDMDADGDPLAVTAVNQPTGGTAALTASGIRFVPEPNRCGAGVGGFDYTVSDGRGGIDVGHTTVDLTCVDDAPVAVNDIATVAGDAAATPVDVHSNDTDIDGGPMVVDSVTQPTNGAVVVTGGGTGLTYQPIANYCNSQTGGSPDIFSYTLNGGSTATVSMTVTCPPVVSGPRWPTSIENRKVLDQYGDVYLIRTFSSWGMASNLSDTDIASALDAVAANGFNGVTVWFGGGAYYGEDWGPTYQQKATGQAFWNGTPWASGLGPAWASLDHLVAEAERRGIFVWMSLDGGLGVPRADWEAVTNADMFNAGVAVATRYLQARNVGWHVMIDDATVTTDGTVGQRIEAFFHGVNNTEGASARPVRWLENGGGKSTNEQGWLGTTGFNATINTWYQFGGNSTEIAETGYGEVAVPVGDCEPPYDGSPHYGGDLGQQLRERSYATFLEGGSLINYGHEDWWPFGLTGLYSEGLTWQGVRGHVHTLQQSYVWSLLDQFVVDTGWVPDGSFVVAGTGGGDTKAAAGRSGRAALAYFPSSRSVVVDTTVLAGAAEVRLRWYDPTSGAYSAISTSEPPEANRTVAYPPAHPDGTTDWVLVIDLPSPPSPP